MSKTHLVESEKICTSASSQYSVTGKHLVFIHPNQNILFRADFSFYTYQQMAKYSTLLAICMYI